MTRTIHYCNFCDYKSDRRYDRDKHVSRKHANDHSSPSQAGSGTAQSVQPHSENEKHSNLQEESIDQLYENIDQLYENIDQWQKAYNNNKVWSKSLSTAPQSQPGSHLRRLVSW